MKTNKKAVLGMLVAIVMSLGVMGGINNSNDSSLQQVGIGCEYMSTASEGGAVGAWGAAGAIALGAAGQIATGGTILGWTPVGWGMWVGAGVCAL